MCIVWRKVPANAEFLPALLDHLLIELEYYDMAEKRHKFQSIWHSSSLWMAMMLMVTAYDLTLMMMSALMSYRSSCPIYHYRVNGSVSWTFRSVWTKDRDTKGHCFLSSVLSQPSEFLSASLKKNMNPTHCVHRCRCALVVSLVLTHQMAPRFLSVSVT